MNGKRGEDHCISSQGLFSKTSMRLSSRQNPLQGDQNNRVIGFILLLIFIMYSNIPSFSQVRLPKLISDGMVLQRDINLKIWGWANAGEKVSVNLNNTATSTVTESNGKWSVTLGAMKAGGPYDLEIIASNRITVHDVLIGDVWMCSGQSNMEMGMGDLISLYSNDIATSENLYIRHFTVPRRYNFNTPQEDFTSGSWQSANPKTVLGFSAVAYFFARDLYTRYKVPIGLINASLGGSPAEAWMSEEALHKFPELYKDGLKYKDAGLIDSIDRANRSASTTWQRGAVQNDIAYKSNEGSWRNPGLNTTTWNEMNIPGYWANETGEPINGVFWFRKDFDVPASVIGKESKLLLGRIVDSDSTFLNGTLVGNTGSLYSRRAYTLPPTFLKTGKNTLVIRVANTSGKGGFVSGKQYAIVVGSDTIDLRGKWKYKIGVKMDPMPRPTLVMWKPGGLFKGMLAPVLNYAIKGAIWYQGESNVSRAIQYRDVFPAMIRDWRDQWKQGEFPFLFVQLPNYNEPQGEPSESSEWALLREAQLKTLSVPKTAMAVAIDVGEWNDIHPLRKKEVGVRLSLAAQHIAYDDTRKEFSGPLFQSMKLEGNRIILSFKNTGRGLVTKGNKPLKYFSIAGADKKFVWASAEIKNNKVIVWSDGMIHPVAVRYAWADDPEGANLFNQEGLPASPFRTDDN
jgi:sialate O-acetylesterase